jgi:hypothetical protein
MVTTTNNEGKGAIVPLINQYPETSHPEKTPAAIEKKTTP